MKPMGYYCLIFAAVSLRLFSPVLANGNVLDQDKTTQTFIASLQNENVEYGWCESRLFGASAKRIDKQGIANKAIKIFYLVRKANRPDAPYVIFFNGGPAIAFTDLYHQHSYKTFLPEFNVVFMDQRGNGLSTKPSADFHALKYYSARYISYDAELLRRKIAGENAKWIVFGQSYGGVVARKYIELYPNRVLVAITHGSAKYSAVDVAVNTEVNTHKRVREYFEKYPGDMRILKELQAKLKPGDHVDTADYKLSGRAMIDFLYIHYAIYPDERMHELFGSIAADDPIGSFIGKIKPLAETILTSASLASVVSFIDLSDDKTGKEISSEAKKILGKRGVAVEDQVISKIRLDDTIATVSEKQRELDDLIENKYFKSDPIDLKRIASNLEKYKFHFHVYGSYNDALAINSIKDEESLVEKIGARNWRYHYSDGNHREWLNNKALLAEALSPYHDK